ncbi:hypothetical protein [Candidatus Poriferisodalis sp.]|uniref:hypothetical protein n=1 Tax=Candidatus Poriferisodalis sp. TaxID=3101277 RepID=UPI003B5243D5
MPEPTESTTSTVSVTAASTPTTAPAVAEDAVEQRTELDFRIDPDRPDDEEPNLWLIGENVASGLWQWSDSSGSECLYLVMAPTAGPSGARIVGSWLDQLVHLDAREPVALLSGEQLLGYSDLDDGSKIIAGSSHPQCFLEWIAENDRPESEMLVERYGERGEDDAGFEPTSNWVCQAHSGPEPVDRLDWRGGFGSSQPEASCEVGVGILAGWWQWTEQSSPECIYVVVDTGDELDQALHRSHTRRDARSPVLLSEGEIVLGYSDSKDEYSGFTAAMGYSVCFLEHIAPEDEPSA